MSYSYNQNGIRDSKTVNGVTTTYYLDRTKVLYETDGTNDIYYTYDVDGSLLSINYNGTEYYYVLNVLGDVTHLIDSTGDVVVEYRYDSYGNLEDSITLTGVGLANPYRYRSYRFDNETGYYYLQSRYYNPETGRFINADGVLTSSSSTLGHNMYTYVNNNPVMLVDSTGYLPEWREKIKRNFRENFLMIKDIFDIIEEEYREVNYIINKNTYVYGGVGIGIAYEFDDIGVEAAIYPLHATCNLLLECEQTESDAINNSFSFLFVSFEATHSDGIIFSVKYLPILPTIDFQVHPDQTTSLSLSDNLSLSFSGGIVGVVTVGINMDYKKIFYELRERYGEY